MENKEKTPKVFVNGMRFEAPTEIMKEKTPWIKGRIAIKSADLVAFLKEHTKADGWVNVDLKKAKESGKLYLELNTYKPTKAQIDEVKQEVFGDKELTAEDVGW